MLASFLLVGCRQQMAEQPRSDPLEVSDFFSDGAASRTPVAGTVARGHLRDDDHRFTGKRRVAESNAATQPPASAAGAAATKPTADPSADPKAYENEFPFPVTDAVMQRGRERYQIYCTPCHGPAGRGDGVVVERGFTPPPVFANDLSRGFERRGVKLSLREAPVGYLFHVISQGYGAMPDHASQIPVDDRWAIVAYIRALQSIAPPAGASTVQASPAPSNSRPSPEPIASADPRGSRKEGRP